MVVSERVQTILLAPKNGGKQLVVTYIKTYLITAPTLRLLGVYPIREIDPEILELLLLMSNNLLLILFWFVSAKKSPSNEGWHTLNSPSGLRIQTGMTSVPVVASVSIFCERNKQTGL